jgi:hypothetical protein
MATKCDNAKKKIQRQRQLLMYTYTAKRVPG